MSDIVHYNLWIVLEFYTSANFYCGFLNPIMFSNLNYSCSNVLFLRNLHEQVKVQLFWKCHKNLKKSCFDTTEWKQLFCPKGPATPLKDVWPVHPWLSSSWNKSLGPATPAPAVWWSSSSMILIEVKWISQDVFFFKFCGLFIIS